MHTQLFPLIVSNFTTQSVTSVWRVSVIDFSNLKGDILFRNLKAKPLPVINFGLIEHRCDQFLCRKEANPVETLQLALEPGVRTEIALVVDTEKELAPDAPLQIVFLAIQEKRSDGLTGGVLVAVTSNGGAFVVPEEDLAPRPVPLAVVDGPRFQADTVFRKIPVQTDFDRAIGGGFLGFLVRNTSSAQLRAVVFYLECVSLPGVQWESYVFEIDVLESGEEFFAAFPFDPSNAEVSEGCIRMVGYSADHDRTRMDVEVRILDSRNR
jgi:hypothetical protein